MLFFSSQGVSAEGEISGHSEAETALYADCAERRVFLMDAPKLGVKCTFRLCGRERVSDFLCDVPLPWEETHRG